MHAGADRFVYWYIIKKTRRLVMSDMNKNPELKVVEPKETEGKKKKTDLKRLLRRRQKSKKH